MEPLTSYQRAQYSFRRYLMHYYSKGAGAKLPKAQRYYDIVNQTDPEVLFSHLKEETLIRKMVDDAISKSKPPDDAVFNRVRTVLEGNLHHEAELERNRLAIPDDWTDEDLFEYHDELKQIRERIGSVPENLPELRKIDHDPEGPQNTPENRARSAHYLGTKSQAGQLQYSSKNVNPRLRAAETVLLNMPDRERIKVIEMDKERASFKAFEEGQRINQELGLPPQERRTARPGRTGSALTSQANYEKYATPELVEVTDIPVKGKRKAAKALAAAGITGFSLAGLPASAAETAIRLDIATDTKNPIDFLQFGLSGISNVADVIPMFGELLSTPADAANVFIDEIRDPTQVDPDKIGQGAQYRPPEDTSVPDFNEAKNKVVGAGKAVVEGTVDSVQQGLGALESLYQKAKDKLPSITLGGYSGF